MSKLASLRTRLDELRAKRHTVRVGAAASAVLVAAVWSLLGIFAIDWCFELSIVQRLILIAAGGGAVYWAYRRYAQPFLGVVETELDMALLVERHQKIDSDLVAALQFEAPTANGWGSQHLQSAVIDYVAEFGQGLNIFEGFSREQLTRRAQLLVGTLVVLGLAIAWQPAYARVFLNRILMGSAHYPTRTTLVDVTVNGTSMGADPSQFRNAQGTKRVMKLAYGQPLVIDVLAGGVLPEDGRVEVRTVRSGLRAPLDLTKSGEPADGKQKFSGQLPRLVDAIDFQIYLGDAWTDPARLVVIQLPSIELDAKVTPPPYATSRVPSQQGGSRQISVLEGSRVDMTLTSDKPLSKAVLKVGKEQVPLVQAGTQKTPKSDRQVELWKLPAGKNPLSVVREELAYEIDCYDAETTELVGGNQAPDLSIQGSVRIEVDRPPRVVAEITTRNVMPEARPKIFFGATDDYGLGKLRLRRSVVKQGTLEATELPTIDLPLDKKDPTAYQSSAAIDFAELKLAKGDQLKVIVEAIDDRGEFEGKSALSDPLLFSVTDKQGVYEAMLESDKLSDRQLDAIIRRQLGIGESR